MSFLFHVFLPDVWPATAVAIFEGDVSVLLVGRFWNRTVIPLRYLFRKYRCWRRNVGKRYHRTTANKPLRHILQAQRIVPLNHYNNGIWRNWRRWSQAKWPRRAKGEKRRFHSVSKSMCTFVNGEKGLVGVVIGFPSLALTIPLLSINQFNQIHAY